MNKAHPDGTALRKDALGWVNVVFLVIAANGPLTALVGCAPLVIGLGNGGGAAGTYLVVGLMYLLFSVGFCAMSRYVRNAGAFYAYIAHGLGPRAGVSGACLAIVAYNAALIACYAMIGFFVSSAIQAKFGYSIPWWGVALFAMLVVFYFGYKNIEFGGKFLLILMLAEVSIILFLDGSILWKTKATAISLAPFYPSHVFGHGFGAALVFVVACYVGFETTAIYSEEVRDPARSIPRATYAAVTIIMAFYACSVALATNAYGVSQAVALSVKDPGNMWYLVTERYAGTLARDITNTLMVTSLLAALISLHNTSARYLFSLGRDGVIGRCFAKVHGTQQTPYVGGTVQVVFSASVIVAAAICRVDPMLFINPLFLAASSVGVIAVQGMTALAVIGFFLRDPRGVSVWTRLIAPTLTFMGMFACMVEMIMNFDLLTGSKSLLSEMLPWLTLGIGFLPLLLKPRASTVQSREYTAQLQPYE